MKNLINFFAVSLIVLSGTMYAVMDAPSAPSAPQIKIDQTKTPNGISGATGAIGGTGAALQKAENVIPADKAKEAIFITDHDLAKEIYKAIRDDRTITNDSKIKIIVTVYNGKVTLSGVAINQAEKERAELLANQVNKLKGVVNDIKVAK